MVGFRKLLPKQKKSLFKRHGIRWQSRHAPFEDTEFENCSDLQRRDAVIFTAVRKFSFEHTCTVEKHVAEGKETMVETSHWLRRNVGGSHVIDMF